MHRLIHPHGRQEFALGRPCFIADFLRVQIERRPDLAVTQDSLHGSRVDFRFVHQPVTECVAKIVKSEPLAVLDVQSGFFCGRPQIIGDEYARAEPVSSLGSQRAGIPRSCVCFRCPTDNTAFRSIAAELGPLFPIPSNASLLPHAKSEIDLAPRPQ
jgi:hypothetical protein